MAQNEEIKIDLTKFTIKELKEKKELKEEEELEKQKRIGIQKQICELLGLEYLAEAFQNGNFIQIQVTKEEKPPRIGLQSIYITDRGEISHIEEQGDDIPIDIKEETKKAVIAYLKQQEIIRTKEPEELPT